MLDKKFQALTVAFLSITSLTLANLASAQESAIDEEIVTEAYIFCSHVQLL